MRNTISLHTLNSSLDQHPLPAISMLLPPMIVQILEVPITVEATATFVSNGLSCGSPPTDLLVTTIVAHGFIAGRRFGSATIYGAFAWWANREAVFLHKVAW